MTFRLATVSRLEVLQRTGLTAAALQVIQRAGDMVPVWMGRFDREAVEAFEQSLRAAAPTRSGE